MGNRQEWSWAFKRWRIPQEELLEKLGMERKSSNIETGSMGMEIMEQGGSGIKQDPKVHITKTQSEFIMVMSVHVP